MGRRGRVMALTSPALLAAGLFGGVQPALAARSDPGETDLATAASATTAFFCRDPQQVGTVQGTPDLTGVPMLKYVKVVPSRGGLSVSFKFRKPIVLAPEGVYIAWTVYVYRHRHDASSYSKGTELQFQDRGKGWEPTGWAIVASTPASTTPVHGNVHIDRARDELSTYFPAGFANLRPPFYWFASQQEFRAYLPRASKTAHQDWSVNGSVYSDCPSGVRLGPTSLPIPARLLTATR